MKGGLLAGLALGATLALTACEVEQREDLEPARLPGGVAEAPPALPADIAAREDAWPTHTLEVTNGRDRQVLILAIVGGRVQELGTIGPGSTAGLPMRARDGETVELEARDDQDRLVAEASLTVGSHRVAWQIDG